MWETKSDARFRFNTPKLAKKSLINHVPENVFIRVVILEAVDILSPILASSVIIKNIIGFL